MKEVKFIRKDLEKFMLDNYLEEKGYYIILGTPSKMEFLYFRGLIDDEEAKKIINKDINLLSGNADKLLFTMLAIHIIDTNLIDENEKDNDINLEKRIELLKYLDKGNPTIIDDITEKVNKIQERYLK